MPKLLVYRGLPGSGKTFHARILQKDGWVRVNRDDLRYSLFGKEGVLPWEQEEMVTTIQRNMAQAALNQGRNVVVDDTNLRLSYVRAWEKFAQTNAIPTEFEVEDFFDVPYTDCIEADFRRGERGERWVGAPVIKSMYDRFLKQHGGALPPYEYADPEETFGFAPYRGDPTKEDAVIVDLDGTLAANLSGRGWYEWARVGEDSLHSHIADLVYALAEYGYNIIYMSGREDVCRKETEEWLEKHYLPAGPLFMRAANDGRSDNIVKRELLSQLSDYNVRFALDDRDQVVEMWREIGLPCLQVAPGAF